MILVDDNQKKTIGRITSNRGKYSIELIGGKFEIDSIDSIVGLSKQIKESALPFLS
ncbi:MAG: hypothetical protein RL110_1137 [Bacteroidota bacterium]